LNKQLCFAVVILGTVLGLAGTDLVLPAIPGLPDSIPGSLSESQLVLASFTAGCALGLLVFGELGARFPQKQLIIAALAGYAALSFYSAQSSTIMELVSLRLFQGFFAAAPAVFAPGMIRTLFDDRQALRALGLTGSIESIVPALAPIFGAWMLTFSDWRASFYLTAVMTIALSIGWFFMPQFREGQSRVSDDAAVIQKNYFALLGSGIFLRYALSQAFTLGGLLVFVFGAPTVITKVMGGTLSDFITMQVIGISLFIVASNSTHYIVDRFGSEKTIFFGTTMAAVGSITVLIYSLVASDYDAKWLWFLFAFVNLGLGFRGPPGFYRAIIAADNSDARGAALVILFVFLTTAIGTAALAPFITVGLIPLAATACAISCSSVIVMLTLPSLPD